MKSWLEKMEHGIIEENWEEVIAAFSELTGRKPEAAAAPAKPKPKKTPAKKPKKPAVKPKNSAVKPKGSASQPKATKREKQKKNDFSVSQTDKKYGREEYVDTSPMVNEFVDDLSEGDFLEESRKLSKGRKKVVRQSRDKYKPTIVTCSGPCGKKLSMHPDLVIQSVGDSEPLPFICDNCRARGFSRGVNRGV